MLLIIQLSVIAENQHVLSIHVATADLQRIFNDAHTSKSWPVTIFQNPPMLSQSLHAAS